MYKNNVVVKKQDIFTRPCYFLAFGFGSGLMPKAPGTWGTLMAIPCYILLQMLSWKMYISLLLCAFIIGIWLCDSVSKDMGVHDHGGIVWDEFVGYWITMAWVNISWLHIVLGFILFRIFDIWKPYPVSWCDKNISGGLGIMLDDVIAGIYAGIFLLGMSYWL